MTEARAPGTATDGPISRGLLPDTSAITADGHLSVGGVDLLDLAEELGTPLFVYDEEHVRNRCREALEGFGPGVAYATKAFLCKAMVALALEEGMALDVSTGGELAVALAGGATGGRLVCHGNNKSSEELAAALAAGVGRIVVDSFDEISRLHALAPARSSSGSGGARTRLLVRVTPGVEAHTHEYVRTGQEDTKFGFSLASGAAGEAVDELRLLEGFDLVGVHAHIGSQIFELAAFAEELAALAPFVVEHGFAECCIGGGLGVAYVEGEEAPTIAEWARVVHTAARTAGLPADVHLTAEPGRAVVAGAAVTLYRVGTIKRLAGLRPYVAVDGGMSDNPRPVLYGSGYEAFLPRAPDASRPLSARVVGKHCESGDVIVDDARLPSDLVVGDVLATPVTGAYGFAMSSNYNRVLRAPVVFVAGGRARVVVRRETMADLLAREA
ncbi:MAG TPA: diaminopimelate decarboxylase [Acidimicrobiales bacterium]|nr:diaminopimelate decarboxylase [Acidimicrobiales bacterium]